VKFFLQNFGCKANRYDAELIAQTLVRDGHRRVSDPFTADIRLVNTCAVTRKAETKALRFIRRVERDGGSPDIIVLGCAVERDPDTFRNRPGIRLALGTREKYDVSRFLNGEEPKDTAAAFKGGVAREGVPIDHGGLERFEGRKRAFLKIQDGCSYRCGYCIVPIVRGRSVSRTPKAIVEEARSLAESGFREIVLTGIHIGLYGRDLESRTSLEKLLDMLLDGTELVRYRLSSIDAHELGEALIDRIAGSDRICNHLHVPLQSGSPEILKAMKRRNSIAEYLDTCSNIVESNPSLGLGTDVIVGYPGESETDFERSCRVVQQLPFSYVHVFPFSPRPGTSAYEDKSGWIQERTVRERALRMGEIGRRSGENFRKGQVGTTQEIVVERKSGTWFTGRCSNYLKAYFQSSASDLEGLVEGEIMGLYRDGVRVVLKG
jgi:threonylcarbamoyladenosine tRNA methylthiotransferase MtaB